MIHRPISLADLAQAAGVSQSTVSRALQNSPLINVEAREGHKHDVVAGQALVHSLLDAGATAVFCYNDMIATGVLLACRDQGRRNYVSAN